MDAITYRQARKSLSTLMNQVCDNHAPIIITRQSEKPVVMMSLEDYNTIEQTLYLLSTPKNAQRLYKALDELKQGKYQEHNLIENESISRLCCMNQK